MKAIPTSTASVLGVLFYEAKTWSLRLGGRWSTYDYPRSYVTLGGVLAELRTRTTVQTEAHFEFRLSPKDRVYLEHTWEREQANRTSDRYSAHVATVGVEHDF